MSTAEQKAARHEREANAAAFTATIRRSCTCDCHTRNDHCDSCCQHLLCDDCLRYGMEG